MGHLFTKGRQSDLDVQLDRHLLTLYMPVSALWDFQDHSSEAETWGATEGLACNHAALDQIWDCFWGC